MIATPAKPPEVEPRALPAIGLEHAGMLMTREEFNAIEEYDRSYRYELIRGVLIVTPVPLPPETGMNHKLGTWLDCYREAHTPKCALDGTLYEQEIDTGDNIRRADRLIWCGKGAAPDVKKDLPTIVVEFVSKAKRDQRRDYEEKKGEYLRLGIPEYWIIDRFRRNMTVLRQLQGKVEEQVVQANEVYRPSLLPGFELPLAKLLEVGDFWARSSGDDA